MGGCEGYAGRGRLALMLGGLCQFGCQFGFEIKLWRFEVEAGQIGRVDLHGADLAGAGAVVVVAGHRIWVCGGTGAGLWCGAPAAARVQRLRLSQSRRNWAMAAAALRRFSMWRAHSTRF